MGRLCSLTTKEKAKKGSSGGHLGKIVADLLSSILHTTLIQVLLQYGGSLGYVGFALKHTI